MPSKHRPHTHIIALGTKIRTVWLRDPPPRAPLPPPPAAAAMHRVAQLSRYIGDARTKRRHTKPPLAPTSRSR
ncbi:hypothetical protein JYU34_004158 [Plutella xylostella]|uniref:Uncharacterized protein n=1 Tax=Plutella xylostella TaxID=51655 RepID=A0ABQ7QXA4_PLUXY|nr:hypothetical protein JYU34_004158 [Plutella xylostella]